MECTFPTKDESIQITWSSSFWIYIVSWNYDDFVENINKYKSGWKEDILILHYVYLVGVSFFFFYLIVTSGGGNIWNLFLLVKETCPKMKEWNSSVG